MPKVDLTDEERFAVAAAFEELVGRFGSQRETAKKTGINQQSISRGLNGISGASIAFEVIDYLRVPDMQALIKKYRKRVDEKLRDLPPTESRANVGMSPLVKELAAAQKWSNETAWYVEMHKRATNAPLVELIERGDAAENVAKNRPALRGGSKLLR